MRHANIGIDHIDHLMRSIRDPKAYKVSCWYNIMFSFLVVASVLLSFPISSYDSTLSSFLRHPVSTPFLSDSWSLQGSTRMINTIIHKP